MSLKSKVKIKIGYSEKTRLGPSFLKIIYSSQERLCVVKNSSWLK